MVKPTKKLIFSRLQELKTHYSARNINFALDDQYYELLFRDKLGLPEEYKEDGVVLPTARDVVDAGTNHVTTIYARFFRPMRGVDQAAKEQAEMLRKFDVGMFYRTKMEAESSPWHIAGKHGCLYGMWCFEINYDPSKVPDEPERMEDESDEDFAKRMAIYDAELYDTVPIVIRALNPITVFPDVSGEFMLIEESKIIHQVKAEWPNWVKPLLNVIGVNESRTKTVTQVTYWDKEYRAIYVDGQPVLSAGDEDGVIAHDYGCLPYVVGYSGLGNQDATSKPEKRAVGLIRYLRSLLRSESFAYSVYNITIKAHSWPITFVSGPGAAALTAIKMKFGKIYEKPAGVTIEDYVKSAPPEIVMTHMQYTNSIIAASGAPRSVRGLPEAGVRSGTDRSIIMSEARLKYDTILEQLQYSTSKVMSICTKIMERVLPSDLHIWARTPDEEFDIKIDKAKIKHHYTTFCEFTSVSPEEEARRHADMINLVKTGIISTSTGRRRYMTHIDPEAEDIRVEAEKLRNDPNVRSVVAQMAASMLAGEAARLTKIKQLQAGMPPMQAGEATSQAALSMPGGAQAISAMVRQKMGTYHPAMPGSPEELAQQMAQAGKPSTGGGLAVPGTPIQSPTPYGQVRAK